MLVLVLRKPHMEGLGPDLECVHPLEAAMPAASVAVAHLP